MKYVIILLLSVGFSGTAFACLCDDFTTSQRISHAEVIFSGTVSDGTWSHGDKGTAAGFDVKTVWKGAESFPLIKNGHVTVITPKVSTACGLNLIKEKDYLIFARIDGNVLHTTTCDGSWFLDGRADDVKALEDIESTHHFIDARSIKGAYSDDCKGPGLFTEEQCEYEKLVRTVLLPIGIAVPIVGVSVFLIWRKRR